MSRPATVRYCSVRLGESAARQMLAITRKKRHVRRIFCPLSHERQIGRDAFAVLFELVAEAAGEQTVFRAHADFGACNVDGERDQGPGPGSEQENRAEEHREQGSIDGM